MDLDTFYFGLTNLFFGVAIGSWLSTGLINKRTYENTFLFSGTAGILQIIKINMINKDITSGFIFYAMNGLVLFFLMALIYKNRDVFSRIKLAKKK